MKRSVIYDYETFGQDVNTCAVISAAFLEFDEDVLPLGKYSYEELVEMSKFYKFDVKEQVEKFNRIITNDTLDWWMEQGKDARRAIQPLATDISLESLYTILVDDLDISNAHRVYCRSNTFDPMITASVLSHFGKQDPTRWWNLRDTRSLFDGMTYGQNIDNRFVPDEVKDKFVKHDPRHDVAMDVYRYQYLAKILS